MLKARDMNGLPVLTFDTGKKIGEVKDTLFSPEQRRILAFLVDDGGWFEEARVVPFASVQSIGPDAVVVPSESVEIKVSRDPEMKTAFDSRRVVTRMKAYSEDGYYLGTIEDMIIDERTGEVQGYEVSGGFWEETMKGRRFMPAPETMRIGEHIVFVPAETARRMKEEVRGGVTKAWEEARESGSAYVGEVKEQAATTKEQVAASAKQQQKKFVIGKTAQAEVIAPDGTVLARRGDTITPQIADEADRRGILNDLVSAVGGAEAQSFMSRLRQETTRAYEEARRAVTGTAERTAQESEQRRIKDALGLPVTRVILDERDSVILNTGEIVTNEAIRRAREAGVLDILLNSVSKAEPSFGIEQRRAPRPGQARLDEQPEDRAL